jgi:hypothetical protein
VKQEAWDRLMEQARREARIGGRRACVVGLRLSDRAARVTGHRWAYVTQCGPDCSICRNRADRIRNAVLTYGVQQL